MALTMVVLPTPGPPVMTRTLDFSASRIAATWLGKGKPDMLLDPWQGLVRIDPGPRQRAICQSRQSLGDRALRAMQASQKHTGRFANPVGDHRALLQL